MSHTRRPPALQPLGGASSTLRLGSPPTYPRRSVPYYLAPLWDAAEFQRAIEAKLTGSSRRGSTARKRARKHGSLKFPGMSPIEEAASNIPKEVKARLKKSRAAKGLLQDLEEEVRGWVKGWNEAELQGRGISGPTQHKNLVYRPRAETTESADSGAVVLDETDEEDEEIVFVGRKGVVVGDGSSATTTDGDISMEPPPTALQDVEMTEDNATISDSKMVFDALEDDRGASFARWLVHCVGSYYGLRTWSVTREAQGMPNMREAYVGIDERAKGFMGRGVQVEGQREIELPRPLWTMV
ncbi:uncharacterized protein AB675_8071 [Cyphellophora attinorum]|uniref:R3H-associated N-terminal domain-containing protein n=1 Tax=Cyphellophora attinorum TaxID=1664694 RepID=A0A0N1NZ79_9EURO|nr:uncharacterized protein AB675_8071 [Phialophora attinorum]KPI41136.1 hypothetical protein AB675_8071 [Phialophora attinorum]